MAKYIKVFQTHNDYVSFTGTQDFILPNVSYCIDQTDIVHYNPFVDYSSQYLTFVALEDGTFSFTQDGIYYSLDDGNTWTALERNTQTPTVTAGNKIMWKGNLPNLSTHYNHIGVGTFHSTGNCRCDVEGNVMSIIAGDDFTQATTLTDFHFVHLLMVYVVNAKNLVLPATTLGQCCYLEMFETEYLLNEPMIPDSLVPLNSYYCAGMFCGHSFTPNGRYSGGAYECLEH